MTNEPTHELALSRFAVTLAPILAALSLPSAEVYGAAFTPTVNVTNSINRSVHLSPSLSGKPLSERRRAVGRDAKFKPESPVYTD
jgi:hypothetical protein